MMKYRHENRKLNISCYTLIDGWNIFHHITESVFIRQSHIKVFERIGGFHHKRSIKGSFHRKLSHIMILKIIGWLNTYT